MDESVFSVKEAAAKLKVSTRTVRRKCGSGELACHRIGEGPRPRIRITRAQLDAYFEQTECRRGTDL